MNWLALLKESIFQSGKALLTMAKIIIPIMVAMEILKDTKILEKVSEKFKFIASFFNISNESIFPLLVGIIFGIAYGAGVIIESAKEFNLSKEDLHKVMIFLVICHAIIEDTLVFVVVDANLWLIFITRILMAIILTFFASKFIDKNSFKEPREKIK